MPDVSVEVLDGNILGEAWCIMQNANSGFQGKGARRVGIDRGCIMVLAVGVVHGECERASAPTELAWMR